MDDGLLDVILGRIDGDTLSEGATELLLAACQGDDELTRAVGGEPPPRPAGGATTTGGTATDPLGAFLSSITVEGFRGIGPAHTFDLHPGTGLTVVAGRNGSGKSSFAEGLEVLLTGSTARFRSYAVFRDGWRNLHHPAPTRLRAEFHLNGTSGTTVVERTWADAADLAGGVCTVQVPGEKVAGLGRLGWESPLSTHGPFLAHSDLEAMFDGRPSDLYDRLAAVLGLGDITATQDRLATQRRGLEATAKAVEATRRALVADLADLDDERAINARTALDVRRPDLDIVEGLTTSGGAASTGALLESLRALATVASPDPGAARTAAAALRTAADQVDAVAGTEAARARSLADLLERAVALANRHPDTVDCPVCGRPDALDHAWRQHATNEIERLRQEAREADTAADAATSAVSAARSLTSACPAAIRGDASAVVDTTELQRLWSAWGAGPAVTAVDPATLRSLADHLRLADGVASEAEGVRRRAAAELRSREDRWIPLALRITGWVADARAAESAEPTVKELKAAAKWLKAAHDDIRNDRLRPIADQAQANWRMLRHESNVDLGPLRLSGSNTQRRLVLDASVDGSGSNALGVMSQGEVNALALSVFLPRAMLPESPFRFIVIDDPVQAMDPAKVDGLARVLHAAGQTHQVVVFTHDDRLPNALRRLDLEARIVQVQRRPGSIVDVSEVSDPATKALSDARSIARDENVPVGVKQRVVPGQCRLAVEAALAEAIVRQQLRSGRQHHEIDDLLADARTLHQKAALAFFGDAEAGQDVLPRLARLGQRHVTTFKNLKSGAHGQLSGPPMDLVKDTGRLVELLEETLA